jgi:hypothetical protein
MTIMQAISQVDGLKFNQYTHKDKVRWLSTVDAMVANVIMASYEGEREPFTSYNPDEDMHRELLIKAPFDEIYIRWMEAMIDYHNEERNGYNASITLYNSLLESYKAWYARNHIPKSRGQRFLF